MHTDGPDAEASNPTMNRCNPTIIAEAERLSRRLREAYLTPLIIMMNTQPSSANTMEIGKAAA